jgi:nitrite reductase (NADH) small subunit
MLTHACTVADVPPGEGRQTVVAGRRIAIFNTPQGFRAIDATCPHRGGPLHDGITAESSVACPLHLRRFDLVTGEAIGHDCPGVSAYAVEVRAGQVFVDLRLGARVGAERRPQLPRVHAA